MSATKFALGMRSCRAIVSAEVISSSMRVLSRVGALGSPPVPDQAGSLALDQPLERDLQAEAAAAAEAHRCALPLGPDDDDRLGAGAPALRHAEPAAGRVAGTGACPLAAWWFAAPRWLWDSVP